MTDPYTPTTAHTREAYVRDQLLAFIASEGEHIAEFDRWLADHTASALFPRWRVRKRGDQWTAIHPTLGVRGVVSNWAAAFGVAYRAAVKEAERGRVVAD